MVIFVGIGAIVGCIVVDVDVDGVGVGVCIVVSDGDDDDGAGAVVGCIVGVVVVVVLVVIVVVGAMLGRPVGAIVVGFGVVDTAVGLLELTTGDIVCVVVGVVVDGCIISIVPITSSMARSVKAQTILMYMSSLSFIVSSTPTALPAVTTEI